MVKTWRAVSASLMAEPDDTVLWVKMHVLPGAERGTRKSCSRAAINGDRS